MSDEVLSEVRRINDRLDMLQKEVAALRASQDVMMPFFEDPDYSSRVSHAAFWTQQREVVEFRGRAVTWAFYALTFAAAATAATTQFFKDIFWWRS